MKFVSVLFLATTLFVSTTHAAKKEVAFDANVPATLKAQMLEDLKFMGSIRSTNATQMHTKVFGDVSGEAYLKFFDQRVLKVGVSDCGSPNAVACVMPMYGKKIWMTKNYVIFSHPQIARLSVVYHEARHTERENGNWGHANCPTPFRNAQGQDIKSIWTGAMLAGEAACDVTPYGSYGSATILLRNVGVNCMSCTEKVRADANMYALDQLQRVVDKASLEAMKKDFGLSRR